LCFGGEYGIILSVNYTIKGEDMEEFQYVVASRWDEEVSWGSVGNLCIYSAGSEIQQGTDEDAKSFLGYVNKMSEGEHKILKVSFTEL
jgi:hypothetical protein